MCTLPGGTFGGAKQRGIIVACILLMEKLVVAGNGRGMVVGCLQQYEDDGGSSGWQQVERHGRTNSMKAAATTATGEVTERAGLDVSPAQALFVRFLLSGYIAGRGGAGVFVMVRFPYEWMMRLIYDG